MDGSLAKTTGVRTVTAAVAVAPLRTELRRLPAPAVGPDDGLLAVDACGLCGTDWDFYTRQRGAHLGPLILGHEIVGRVAALGEDAAKRWNITSGDRIAVEEFLPCGQCEFCRSGRPALCEATDSRSEGPFLRYGATSIDIPPGLWGGFSEILYLHPHALVHRIPDDLSSDLATLFVPVSNGVRWVLKEGRLPRGGTAVIIGPGAHGLGCVVAAVEGGARHVIAVSRSSAARLEAARALGAIPIAADRTDVVAKVREITNGEMADLIVDLAGCAGNCGDRAGAGPQGRGDHPGGIEARQTGYRVVQRHRYPKRADGQRSPRTRLPVRGGSAADHRLAPLSAGAHPHPRVSTRPG